MAQWIVFSHLWSCGFEFHLHLFVCLCLCVRDRVCARMWLSVWNMHFLPVLHSFPPPGQRHAVRVCGFFDLPVAHACVCALWWSGVGFWVCFVPCAAWDPDQDYVDKWTLEQNYFYEDPTSHVVQLLTDIILVCLMFEKCYLCSQLDARVHKLLDI